MNHNGRDVYQSQFGNLYFYFPGGSKGYIGSSQLEKMTLF